MKLALSFCFSFCLVVVLLALFWVVGVIGQSPAIPVQTPNVSYSDIILHQKKRNPIDDHNPVRLVPRHFERKAADALTSSQYMSGSPGGLVFQRL
ncbi:MAG TPA: hypothetical protein VNO50_01490 [Pyrinomonadaceae bacterium]|nr:hypothetical protein [Pyrinomonadaceae bacterium]